MEYNALTTEQLNEKSLHIDEMDTLSMVKLINEEDKKVAVAVEEAAQSLAKAIDLTAERLKNGGRLFYVGAGTSGRLGILDASECPPTYGTPYEMVQGLIAGGKEAAFRAAEGAEDNAEAMVAQLKEHDFCQKDVCVAISASGSAPCVHGALEYAKSIGALAVSVQCNKNSTAIPLSDVSIVAEVGPEVINGSTRMKAGTATKLILNTLSTGVMVRLGRVKGNSMVYMKPTNKKLMDRAVRMVMAQTGKDYDVCKEALLKADGDINSAVNALASL